MLWWISWLLLPTQLAPKFPHSWPGLALLAIAGLTLIAITEIVSHGPVGAP